MPSGQILYQGRDLLSAPDRRMRQIRGSEIAMIFQEPMTSLNPVFTIGDRSARRCASTRVSRSAAARERAVELLDLVRIPDAARRVDDYPHQLSGGMRQRVMIAMALACKPRLLIADEPTTALDVTIQAQILELLRDLRKRVGHGRCMLITHDLGVVAERRRVVVMYAGRVVEEAPVRELFRSPGIPTPGPAARVPWLPDDRAARLATSPGWCRAARRTSRRLPLRPRCHTGEDRCLSSYRP